jgi:type II secretory pathway pseudopilin PulG
VNRRPVREGRAGLPAMRTISRHEGYTLLELLFVVSLLTTLAGLAVPVASSTIDQLRAASAARYIAGRIAAARLEAIRRSSAVALRFDPADADYSFAAFVDGNGNGLRTLDVSRGVDRPAGRAERLQEHFPDTAVGLLPGVPDIDGSAASSDGLRIGSTPFLSLAPDGTATSGTVYVRSRRGQYAVRILGATGRVRIFRFEMGARTWISR